MNLGSMSAVALKRTRLRYQSDLAKLTPHQESIATNGAIQVYTLHGDVAFKPLMMTPVTAQGATTAPYARPWLLALISIPRPSFGSTWLTHLSSALKHPETQLAHWWFGWWSFPGPQGGPWWGHSSCCAANWIIRSRMDGEPRVPMSWEASAALLGVKLMFETLNGAASE